MATAASDYPKPRHDKVLVRVESVERRGGLVMPQNSLAGRRYVVQAVGTSVQGLAPGDIVMMTGDENVNWAFLPGHNGLIIISDDCVPVVLGRVEADAYEEVHQ